MPRNLALDRALSSLTARQREVLSRFCRNAFVRTRVRLVERALVSSAICGPGSQGAAVVLDLKFAKTLEYKDLSARLLKRAFIRPTRRWFERLCYLTNRRPSTQPCEQCAEQQLPDTVNVAEVLQAYKIACFPNICLQNYSSLDECLFKASEAFVQTYEAISRKVNSGVRWEDICSDLKSNFPKRLASYLRFYKVLMLGAVSHEPSGLDR